MSRWLWSFLFLTHRRDAANTCCVLLIFFAFGYCAAELPLFIEIKFWLSFAQEWERELVLKIINDHQHQKRRVKGRKKNENKFHADDFSPFKFISFRITKLFKGSSMHPRFKVDWFRLSSARSAREMELIMISWKWKMNFLSSPSICGRWIRRRSLVCDITKSHLSQPFSTFDDLRPAAASASLFALSSLASSVDMQISTAP